MPALADGGALRELRPQVFMPWNRRLWNTPNVAHDNPTEQRFHASLILGFTDAHALGEFYGSERIAALSGQLPQVAAAVHACEVADALTYVKDGAALPPYHA